MSPTKAKGTLSMDRRGGGKKTDRRKPSDRRNTAAPVAVERRKLERRAKVTRRRQIDPTTCERDYSTEEVEFMNAMELYKRQSGRMFPTCSEVLEVIKGLGYQKVSTAHDTPFQKSLHPQSENTAESATGNPQANQSDNLPSGFLS